MKDMEAIYRALDQDAAESVAGLINSYGVPATLEDADRLADALYPALLDRRRDLWSREAALLLKSHPNLMIPEPRHYPITALQKLIRNCAGLSPKPQLMQLELFDPATIAMQVSRIAPAWLPDDPDVRVEMIRRLSGGVGRHMKQASRDLVTDAAKHNKLRFARRLSGAENCAFCAMLASRGAVYSSEKAAGALRAYHDNCDCTVELVEDPKNWDGKDEADELYQMWLDAGDAKSFASSYRASVSSCLCVGLIVTCTCRSGRGKPQPSG